MQPTINEATDQFLRTAARDLQQQMSLIGAVNEVTLDTDLTVLRLRAEIRVQHRTIEVEGVGDSLVSAYADLRRRVAEPVLAAAFREVMGG